MEVLYQLSYNGLSKNYTIGGSGRICTYEGTRPPDFTYLMVSQKGGLYLYPYRILRYLVSTVPLKLRVPTVLAYLAT